MTSKNKAIIYMIIAAFSFGMMSMAVRAAGSNVPSIQKAFFRNIVVTVVIALLFIKNRQTFKVEKRNIGFLIARSLVGTLGMVCFYYAIDVIPLADASLLHKLSPFFLIILSFFFLKEKVNIYQAGALMLAIVGAFLVIRPGFNSDIQNYLIGVCGGFFAATAYLFVRILGNRGVAPKVTVLSFSLISTLLLGIYVIPNFVPMNTKELLFLVLAGTFAMGGQLFLTNAYAIGKAKDIAIFDYTQIIFVGIMAMIFFDEIPDWVSVIGYVVIIGAALIATKFKGVVKSNDELKNDVTSTQSTTELSS